MTEHDWRNSYRLKLAITDAAIICWAVFGVQLLWLGSGRAYVDFSGDFSNLQISYVTTSIVISVSWIVLLSISGSRKPETVGSGVEEYRRVSIASFRLFALLAAIAYLTQMQLARGYVLIAVPLGMFLLLLGRWLWRQWLVLKRAQGNLLSRAVIVGSRGSVETISKKILNTPSGGFGLYGAFLSRNTTSNPQLHNDVLSGTNVPILGFIDEAVEGMRLIGADTLIIASADDLSPEDVRLIGWQLKPGRETLVVAPNILDVSGPRIHIRPVSGLPLIQIETPTISGSSQIIKRAIDLLASCIGLLLLSPVFLIIAWVIKSTSSGPVFFTQERIGRGGVPFTMFKFRTMSHKPETIFPASLQDISLTNERLGNEVLFKIKNDPRITKPGKWLRKYSIDELPQLFNVLKGNMSLVGPRPPLASEVALYDDYVMRRFLAKPGMTGLWQVTGRSDLSWEESVRADLMYVENWSLITDFIILWRTVQVVITGRGAY